MMMTNFLQKICSVVFLFSIFYFLFSFSVHADDYSSSNFRIRDPGITSGGGEISSTNFRLQGAVGQVLIGTSSASNFQLCIGVFCFPAPAPAPVPPPAPPPAPPSGGAEGGGIIESILRLIGFPSILRPTLPLPVRPAECPYPPTDLNCDGVIGVQDLSILLYLAPQSDPNPADFNRDREVDIKDLSIMFSDWSERLLTFAPEAQARLALREPVSPGTPPGFAFVGESLLQAPPVQAEEGEEAGREPKIGWGGRIILFLQTGFDVIRRIFGALGEFFAGIWRG